MQPNPMCVSQLCRVPWVMLSVVCVKNCNLSLIFWNQLFFPFLNETVGKLLLCLTPLN